MSVKLRGVYDLELFRYLKQIGVKHFGFDLRPTSFNFTPTRKIVEMLESAGDTGDKCFFMFGDEKDFVVEQLTAQIRRKTALRRANCFLEFTDAKDVKACARFGHPFIWRFQNGADYRKIPEVDLLAGISVSYEYLEELRESNQLYPFILELGALKRADQYIDLRLDWNDHLSENVTGFLQAETFSYEVGPKVENGYRHINMGLVGSHLDHARRILDLDT